MSGRTVVCSKLKREAPGLEKIPFSGPLGQEIYEKVSAEAFQDWQENMMIKVINEYRLNLADEEQYQVLMKQLKAFLGLSSDETVLEVENAERGKGA
jgi:Fe-S cluster biosynthesis and repair protein YggX